MSPVEICWCPSGSRDKFLTIGTDISLYQTKLYSGESAGRTADRSTQPGCFWTSTRSSATLLSSNSISGLFKCFAWHPKPQFEHLVAVGYVNGTVSLTTPNIHSVDMEKLIGREFSPKHPRPCHCVVWHPVKASELAICLDKHRSESSLFVWNVVDLPEGQDFPYDSRRFDQYTGRPYDCSNPQSSYAASIVSVSSNWSSGKATLTGSSSGKFIHKAVFETGVNEATYSCDWFREGGGHSLVCGVSNKFLRIYDTRTDPLKAQMSIGTKAVYGVQVDPHGDNLFLSYHDCQVQLWDRRKCEKPLWSTTEHRPVVKLRWDPMKSDVFSVLSRDSTYVKVFNWQRSAHDEFEPSCTEFQISPRFVSTDHIAPAIPSLSSYDWHPSEANRLLAITSSNGHIAENVVCYRLPISWSAGDKLIFASDKRTYCCSGLDCCAKSSQEEDIAEVMKRRAINGYGLTSLNNVVKELSTADKFGDLPGSNLEWIWQWLSESRTLLKEKEKQSQWRFDLQFPGVNVILGLTARGLSSGHDSSDNPLTGNQEIYAQGHYWKVFHSPARERVLELCGWGPVHRDRAKIDALIQRLLETGERERAAALLMFTQRLKQAIQILGETETNGAAGPGNLNLVAMALAGYVGMHEKDHTITPTQSSSWHQMCQNVLPTLKSPYLRAIFKFLTCKSAPDSDYSPILASERNLVLSDRVGLAVLFLNDEHLKEFLRRTTQEAIEKGELSGLLFTGLGSPESISLLQMYLDNTSDVQTAAILLLHSNSVPLAHIHSPITSGATKSNSAPVIADLGTISSCFAAASRIYDSYRNFLNELGLYHIRARMDMLRCSLAIGFEATSPAGDIHPSMSTTSLLTGLTGSYATLPSRAESPGFNEQPGSPLLPPSFGLESAHNSPPAPASSSLADFSQLPGATLARLSLTEKRQSLVPSQVYISCTYCGRSLALSHKSRAKGVLGLSCPSCVKPMPRCSICLQRLGSSNDTYRPDPLNSTGAAQKYAAWVSWCQTCRHGGHSAHLTQWFQEHSECPVIGCNCKCSELDVCPRVYESHVK